MTETALVWYGTLTMDSLVCAMSVITPSEMMSRMKYCEPSITADAYLGWRDGRRDGDVNGDILTLKSVCVCSERSHRLCSPTFFLF